MKEKHQLISSLVVFNHLKDKGKNADDILDSFIIYIIKDKQLKTFNYFEMYEYLKNEFGFGIPQVVIQKRLHKIAKNEPNFFICKNKKFETTQVLQDSMNINSEIEKAVNDEKKLLQKLFSFIEVKLKREMLDDEKEIIKNNFIGYFLGNMKEDEYKIYINAFIVENQDNNILKNVSNGIVVYNGLAYQNTFEGRNFERLNIYINMEIIFHYMGYNGIIFKQIVDELFEIITEINRKKKVIYLYYTSKEKSRIEEFFNAISKNTNSQRNVASQEIIKKCGKDKIKIDNEFIEVFKKLENNGFITNGDLSNIDFNLDKSKSYNINSTEALEEVKKVLKENNKDAEDIEENLEFLNKLSILRANHQCTIENAKYIFLTEERSYINLANSIKKDVEQTIPLALTIQYLTSILWYKLGHKFSSKKEIPLLFKADTRAKISLALDMNKHSDSLYDEVEKRKEELQEQNAKEILYNIKSMPTKPEDIDCDNVEYVLELSNADLEYFVNKQEKDKNEKNQLENENQGLKTENKKLSQELNEKDLENERLLQLLKEEKEKLRQKENTGKAEQLKRKIIFYKIKQWGGIALLCILISIVYNFIPKEWIEKIQAFLWLFGGVGVTISLWIYKNLKQKIDSIKNQLKEL